MLMLGYWAVLELLMRWDYGFIGPVGKYGYRIMDLRA